MTKRENIINKPINDDLKREVIGLFNMNEIDVIIGVKEFAPKTSAKYKIADKLYKIIQKKIERKVGYKMPDIAFKEFLKAKKEEEDFKIFFISFKSLDKYHKLEDELYQLLLSDLFEINGYEGTEITISRNLEEHREFKFKNLDFKQIDEATEKPKSIDEQVINDLQIHFKPSKTFKGVNNEIIKQKLGINISDKKLKQLIKKAFKNIKIRGSNNYFLETI